MVLGSFKWTNPVSPTMVKFTFFAFGTGLTVAAAAIWRRLRSARGINGCGHCATVIVPVSLTRNSSEPAPVNEYRTPFVPNRPESKSLAWIVPTNWFADADSLTLNEYDSCSNTGRLSFASVTVTVSVAVDDSFGVVWVSSAIIWSGEGWNDVLVSELRCERVIFKMTENWEHSYQNNKFTLVWIFIVQCSIGNAYAYRRWTGNDFWLNIKHTRYIVQTQSENRILTLENSSNRFL